MICRNCGAPLEHVFLDLGSAPPSNSYLDPANPAAGEVWYPLKVFVCGSCFLVQLDEFKSHSDIFSGEYAYFSSYSSSWLAHARRYSLDMIERFHLDSSSFVVEIASNDGYLLRNFVEAGIPCLGVDPTTNTAMAARAVGVETMTEFFGSQFADRLVRERGQADLVAGNNVLAHVPDIVDFVNGVRILLKAGGIATFEHPHLLKMVTQTQFDTIYHEHFSYLSVVSMDRLFGKCGLRIFDVEELPTHGGSLRLYVCHAGAGMPESTRVGDLLQKERHAGMATIGFYTGFQEHADLVKDGLLEFLIRARRENKRVCAYGAAAKGNTILNYAGIRPDLLPFVVDASPHKQGKLLPGSRIPIFDESRLREFRPEYVLILPWNLRSEISNQLSYIQEWGGQFVTAIPRLSIFPAGET
jgi:SAM-dependent methyltransferase